MLRRALDQQQGSAPEQAAPDAVKFVLATAAAMRSAARRPPEQPRVDHL
jgi:hypothetical protein